MQRLLDAIGVPQKLLFNQADEESGYKNTLRTMALTYYKSSKKMKSVWEMDLR